MDYPSPKHLVKGAMKKCDLMYEGAQVIMTQNEKIMDNSHSNWENNCLKDQYCHRKHLVKLETEIDR